MSRHTLRCEDCGQFARMDQLENQESRHRKGFGCKSQYQFNDSDGDGVWHPDYYDGATNGMKRELAEIKKCLQTSLRNIEHLEGRLEQFIECNDHYRSYVNKDSDGDGVVEPWVPMNLQSFDVLPRPALSSRSDVYFLIVEETRPDDRTPFEKIRNISIHATRALASQALEEMKSEIKRPAWWSSHPAIGITAYGVTSIHHRIRFEMLTRFCPEYWEDQKMFAFFKVCDVFDETPGECEICGASCPKNCTICTTCGASESRLFWEQAGQP